MSDDRAAVVRWVILGFVILCVIALIAFARGAAHHRGQEVGHSAPASAALFHG